MALGYGVGPSPWCRTVIMLNLLERNVESIAQRMVLLAPPHADVPSSFRSVTADFNQHRQLVGALQQLRGSVYLKDGAIRADQLAQGRHRTSEDSRSWHLLMLGKDGEVNACVWCMIHDDPRSIDELRVRHAAQAGDDAWRENLQNAVHAELDRARQDNLRYAEVGGWAVAPRSRCTAEGPLLALAAYSLGRIFGGSLGLTTATVRHRSSTILRRLGGSPLEANGLTVPPYFDSNYGCEMELLRFDSRRPSPKYNSLIDSLRDRLANVTVVLNAARAGAAPPASFAA
jgi:hypothetical protein